MVEALQGKTCQNSLPSGGVGHLEPKFQGEGVDPGEYFLVSTKLDTFCCPTMQTAHARPMCRRFDTIPACDKTDGIAVANTALAMRALRRAVESLTVQALQGKRVKTRCYQEGVGHLEPRFQGRGRHWGIFFGFYKTRHILLSNSCTVLRVVVLTQYRRMTDRQTVLL